MAPQTSIPVAANVLGTIGTVFWCVQLVPQIWYNWKKKKTDGLPALMMFLWALCAFPFGVYAIVQNFNIPIQIQPQIFCCLSLVSFAQILIYSHQWPTWKATSLSVALGAVFGGVEVLLILTLRGPYNRGVSWPMVLVGVIAAVLLAAGIIPPYPELIKRGGRVVGINFIFLAMDWLGAFFSLMAVVAQQTFDVLGGVLYICCIMLEAGIFLSHFIWLIRTRKLRKQAKDAGIDFDDLPEARKYQVAPKERDLEEGETPRPETSKRRLWSRRGKVEETGPGMGPESLESQETAVDEPKEMTQFQEVTAKERKSGAEAVSDGGSGMRGHGIDEERFEGVGFAMTK